jgi:hypothetical protein
LLVETAEAPMNISRTHRLVLPAIALVLPVLFTACNHDNSDVTGSRGSIVTLNVDAPSFAQSGVEFGVDVSALNVGVTNFREGSVAITFEAPLVPRSIDASAGTTATISGTTVNWDLGSLDSNSRSHVEIRVVGTLASGESSRSARIRAELAGRGVSAGDAVATDFVTITP